MNIKSLLYEYARIDETLSEYKKELRDISSRYYITVKAQALTGMPRGSGTSNPSERDALRMIERRKELLNKIVESLQKKRRMELALNKLTDIQRRVIELRYFESTTFEKIRELIKRNGKTTCFEHNNALKILQEELCNENNKTNIENVG
jgi:DNA-directed RNA polymerase specialized sigma24 family protein